MRILVLSQMKSQMHRSSLIYVIVLILSMLPTSQCRCAPNSYTNPTSGGCTTCGPNAFTLNEYRTDIRVCICDGGYYHNGNGKDTIPCVQAPPNEYTVQLDVTFQVHEPTKIPGDPSTQSTKRSVSRACPANTNSPAGSSGVQACSCKNGYYIPSE